MLKILNKTFENFFPFLFISLLIINLLTKIFKRGIYFPVFDEVQNVKYLSFLLTMLFFYNLGKLIMNSTNLKSISLSISYYLLSFFLIDFIFIPITKYINFQIMFIATNILWLIFFVLKKQKTKQILFTLFIYLLLFLFNKFTFLKLSLNLNYKILNSDVEIQWGPLLQKVIDNNLFYAIQNNLIDGYGMLLSYTQAIIYKLLFFSSDFQFNTVLANCIFLLSVFIFLDLNISRLNKIILTCSYFLIILDDGWIRFLMANSLMLEPLISFLIVSFLINFNFLKKEYSFVQKIFFISFFSVLVYSKQFIETIVFLYLLLFLIYFRKNLFIVFGYLWLIISKLLERYYLKQNSLEYLDNSLTEVTLSIIFLKNPKFENISLILTKMLEFKYISLILIYSISLYLFNRFRTKKLIDESFLYLLTILTNIFLIFVLYIFIWKETEIDSSFRYLMNLAHLLFVFLFTEFEIFKNSKKSTVFDNLVKNN